MSFYDELKKIDRYDYLSKYGTFDVSQIKESNCEVIKCDNVLEYMFEQKMPQDGGFGINELVNVKLPFEEVFIEAKIEGDDMGIWSIFQEDRNRIFSVCYYRFKGSQPFSPMIFDVTHDNNGKPIKWGSEWNQTYKSNIIQNFGHKEFEYNDSLYLAYFYVSLLTVQFMHCKNVRKIENDPNTEIPRRVRSHWEKKGKPPLTKYYTLEIEPLKKILKTEGDIEKNGLKLALHICRGHFKDFSDGKGLFGKYKGLYWWDSQVRGHKEYGEVVKDYNVNTLEKGDI